jgi:hypothetical protein|tara:strand:+ start:1028 stop:2533 length:1506 start_codon:yes stop_codon:yes gene_type:complete
MALVTENNRQYYEGAQTFQTVLDQSTITTTFDTNLKFLTDKPTNINYNLNNFKVYLSQNGLPGSYSEINFSNNYPFSTSGNLINFGGTGQTFATSSSPPGSNQVEFNVSTGSIIPIVGMKITLTGSSVSWTDGSAGSVNYAIIESVTLQASGSYICTWSLAGYGTVVFGSGISVGYIQIFPLNTYLVVQLKKLDGGNYGNTIQEKAYGDVVEDNYGSYAYTKLKDIINAFQVAYVGAGKLIPSVKRTDLIFFAKRSMQEFSYDTLKSIKSQELTIPHNLSVIMPQDYVNHVSIGWYDSQGVKHPIYPTNNLTQSPYRMPLQDNKGVPIQDVYDANITTTSVVENRWKNNSYGMFNQLIDQSWLGYLMQFGDWGFGLYAGWGELYGLDPQYANANGWYNINEREGKISFSANLRDKIIILEYISDGLAYDLDTRVPKMAEEAMYASILHAIISTRANQPEYIVMRLKKERYAKLRNAKIRLSNIKLEEITQVMRGKSKWIKH